MLKKYQKCSIDVEKLNEFAGICHNLLNTVGLSISSLSKYSPELLKVASPAITTTYTDKTIVYTLGIIAGLTLEKLFLTKRRERSELVVASKLPKKLLNTPLVLCIDTDLRVSLLPDLSAGILKPYLGTSVRAKKNHVWTFHGTEILKSNAIKIQGFWFEKDVTAVEINKSWFPKVDAHIAIDHTTGKYAFKNTLCYGLVSLDPILSGFFSSDKVPFPALGEEYHFKLVNLTNGNKEKIMPGIDPSAHGYIEHRASGVFYHRSTLSEPVPETAKFFGDYSVKFITLSHTKRRLVPAKDISTEDRKALLCHNYKYGVDSPTDIMSEGKNYTFGVEIETSCGMLPAWLIAEQALNIKVVRDGSVGGGEYVTGVLKGDMGFKMLKSLCKNLAERTQVNHTCGVHTHIGNAMFTPELSIYMYLLGLLIQDELFLTLPKSRRANSYCLKLTRTWINDTLIRILSDKAVGKEVYENTISQLYKDLFKFLSRGHELGQTLNREHGHPGGRYAGGSNGPLSSPNPRYFWLNLINANFSQRPEEDSSMNEEYISPLVSRWTSEPLARAISAIRGRQGHRRGSASNNSRKQKKGNNHSKFTIEFRCHPGTTNYIKIRNWILICQALVSFAENRKFIILDSLSKPYGNLTLGTVLDTTYSVKTATMLKEYLEARKQSFASKDITETEDEKKELLGKEEDKILTIVNDIR